MDPIEFSEHFYDDDLISVGDRMLEGIGRRDFHRRWATHEYLLQWHEGRESGSIRWPALPRRQPGELRPLYLGIASSRQARAEDHSAGEWRESWSELYYTMSKSVESAVPVWNEQGSLAEPRRCFCTLTR
jgi:hypothetical protein